MNARAGSGAARGYMDSTAVLLLDDDAAQRLVLTWCLVPPDIRLNGSHMDVTVAWAHIANVPEERVSRLELSLRGLGVVLPDGGVNPAARAYLDARATAKIAGLGSQTPDAIARNYLAKLSPVEARQWLHDVLPKLFEPKDKPSPRIAKTPPV